MLVAILLLFVITYALLTQSKQNPYLFSKAIIPLTDYIYNKKTIEINTSKNYLLTLNTNKGAIVIDLYSPNAPFNVNNIYKLSNLKSLDNKALELNGGVLNLTSKEYSERVFDEINQNNLNLSPISLEALQKAGYKSDNTVKSIMFEQYSFGVKIDANDSKKNKFFIVMDSTKSKDLDGYNTNVGIVIAGRELLLSSNLIVLNSSINEK